jgi:hypothetical protein
MIAIRMCLPRVSDLIPCSCLQKNVNGTFDWWAVETLVFCDVIQDRLHMVMSRKVDSSEARIDLLHLSTQDWSWRGNSHICTALYHYNRFACSPTPLLRFTDVVLSFSDQRLSPLS